MDFGTVFGFVCIGVVVFFYAMMFLISKKIIRAPWFEKLCDRVLKVG